MKEQKLVDALELIKLTIEQDALGVMPNKFNECYHDLIQQILPIIDSALETN